MDHPNHREMVAVKYPFSQKIRCGCCGAQYIRGQIYSNGEMIPAWWCYSRRRSQKLCSQRGISEASIEKAFVTLLRATRKDLEWAIETNRITIESAIGDAPVEELKEINDKIRDLQKEMVDLHAKKTSGRIIPDAYAKRGSKLASMIDDLNRRKEELFFNESKNKETKRRIDEALKALNSLENTDEFDPQLFKTLIEDITIKNRNELTFNFKIGYSKTITVPIK